MKARLMHGAVIGCATHDRARTYKPRSPKPRSKCPVCWIMWLSDRLETSLYLSDMEDLCKFANAMNKIEFTKIEKEEESVDDQDED
jgi:hypothetical protein